MSVTVGVIRGLIADVAVLKQQIEVEQLAMRTQFELTIAALRQDFQRALGPLQLDNMDHRRAHDVDSNERIVRQMATDLATNSIRRALLFLGILIAVLLFLILIFVLAYASGTW